MIIKIFKKSLHKKEENENEFVIDVDKSDEARSIYESHTTTRYRDKQGILHDPYEDRFYREPTASEAEEHGPMMGTGGNGGVSWHSKDWGDGKGYRAKIHFCPTDMEKIEVPTRDLQSFAEFASEYYGSPIIHDDGRTEPDEDGETEREGAEPGFEGLVGVVGLDGKELLHRQLKQTRVVMPPSPASRPGILNIARVLPLLETRPSIAVKVALVQALRV